MPIATAYTMGLQKPDFIPLRMRMSGAGGDDLGIVGAVVLDIHTEDGRGNRLHTKQFCYVATRISKMFLSRQAMEDLKILPEDFPRPQTENGMASRIGEDDASDSVCDCPRRELVPPCMPTKLPEGFKGSEEEVPQLKEWLLRFYGASTVNVCEHQPLPKMAGSPMRLNMDPNALPVAVHKSASVPVHWREKVKSDLHRDVRLGVLERVPENTPTIWLSRMVVTAKANGTPRLTVDMQPQNRASVRQTFPVKAPSVF